MTYMMLPTMGASVRAVCQAAVSWYPFAEGTPYRRRKVGSPLMLERTVLSRRLHGQLTSSIVAVHDDDEGDGHRPQDGLSVSDKRLAEAHVMFGSLGEDGVRIGPRWVRSILDMSLRRLLDVIDVRSGCGPHGLEVKVVCHSEMLAEASGASAGAHTGAFIPCGSR